MSRWWRAYDEAVDDPKLILLSDRQFRAWFNLCCITSLSGGKLPGINVVAVKLRTTPDKAKRIVAELAALGLVDVAEAGSTMHNWNGRQFKSDVIDPTAPLRQKAYRDRIKNRNGTVTATPTREQNTEAETDTSLRSVARKAVRLPSDAVPNDRNVADAERLGLGKEEIDQQWRQMRDWSASAKGGACLDWDARWRNWCAKFLEDRRGRGPPRNRGMTLGEIVLAAERTANEQQSDEPDFDLGAGPVIEGHAAG